MSEKEQMISKFVELTSANVEEARFYLEATQWNIESALSSFFGNEPEEEDESIEDHQTDIDSQAEIQYQSVNNMNVATESGKPKKTQEPKSKIATLSSLKQNSSDDEDDERHGQAFYVGGSEHGGGQQVLGPPKEGKKPKGQDLNALFKSAQSHGAEIVTREIEKDSINNKKPFSGSGFKLGASSTDVDMPVSGHGSNQDGPQPIKINVKIWSNGFSINDGNLRSLTDPINLEFLRSLSVGQIPKELLQEHKYNKIDLNMEDHSEEEYKEPPKPKVVPFQGSGMMLGSPTPKIITQTDLDVVDISPLATSSVIVNDNEPVTQVQIRLADNSRIVARLNISHTVGDIRRYIVSLHPQYRSVSFTLMTTFPNKLLSDDSITLAEGKLLNAVVVQRLV